MTANQMTKVKFVSTISTMGDKQIINIPKNYFIHTEKLKHKQIRVTIDDEL